MGPDRSRSPIPQRFFLRLRKRLVSYALLVPLFRVFLTCLQVAKSLLKGEQSWDDAKTYGAAAMWKLP